MARRRDRTNIVVGAAGHVGAVVVQELLARGQAVLAIVRTQAQASRIKAGGAEAIVADVREADQLAEAFSRGDTLFMLNPPADPSGDADELERATVRAMLAALRASPTERVVATSTQGAQPGRLIGDLGVLCEMEEGLRTWGKPCRITRAAYYFSNWDMPAEQARDTGMLPSFFPPDFQLAMVAPADVGAFQAARMAEPFEGFSILNLSGPEDYRPRDVAGVLSERLGREVRAAETRRDEWLNTYRNLGFSDASARSYVGMTAIVADRKYEIPHSPHRGTTSLRDYFSLPRD